MEYNITNNPYQLPRHLRSSSGSFTYALNNLDKAFDPILMESIFRSDVLRIQFLRRIAPRNIGAAPDKFLLSLSVEEVEQLLYFFPEVIEDLARGRGIVRSLEL